MKEKHLFVEDDVMVNSLKDTKPKKPDETLKEAIEFLDTAKFNFACFVDCFKRYLKKTGALNEEKT